MIAAMLLALFTTPGNLDGWQRMLMLIPLSLAVAIVYKTIKLENLRSVPVASAMLCVTIVGGMYAVGVGVWLIFLILA